MREPKLYGRYDRHDAVAYFGSRDRARVLCDRQWLILPDVALCFAEVGDPPRMSHFESGSSFCWVAAKRYRVSDDEHVEFVPREVVAGHAEGRTIRLFVRTGDTEQYVYVGELGPACRSTLIGKASFGEAYFPLSPALPSAVWAELGGLRPGDLGHAAVDAALDRLRRAANVEERLGVLRHLVRYWHGEIRPEDGLTEREWEAPVAPYPLRWWYRWAGRRPRILSGQNVLLAPGELTAEDGLLRFYVEDQGCYQWATHTEGDDPPVYGRQGAPDPWEPEGITLAEHLILACLLEAIMAPSPYGAVASALAEEVLDRIVEHIPPIPISPWRWGGSTRFYARGGAFMFTMPHGEGEGRQSYSVWIGAKTEHPLQFLKPFVDESWDYAAV